VQHFQFLFVLRFGQSQADWDLAKDVPLTQCQILNVLNGVSHFAGSIDFLQEIIATNFR
jgi:hypothetical protein